MNHRDYVIYQDGRAAAAHGSGLSDCPHGGADGFLWRQGVTAWLDENNAPGCHRTSDLDKALMTTRQEYTAQV